MRRSRAAGILQALLLKNRHEEQNCYDINKPSKGAAAGTGCGEHIRGGGE